MVEPTTLTTERLLLRPFETSDARDVVAYANDPEFARYLPASIPYPYARADADTFIARCMQQPWDERAEFALVFEGRVIGSVAVHNQPAHHRVGLGYGIGRMYWNRGLTTEAVRAVLDWVFMTFDVVRAYATADAANVGSWSVMRKLGMQHEATLRRHRTNRYGEQIDEVLYGLLRDEWQARR